MTKQISKKNLSSSLKKIKTEVDEIYNSIVNDLSRDRIRFIFKTVTVLPSYSLEEILDKKTKFEVIFTANWADNTIKIINSGFSGLIVDEYNKNNVFDKAIFDNFFYLFNKLLLRNKNIQNELINISIKEINSKYKNKYKLISMDNIFVDFMNEYEDNLFPNICMEIQLERK
ncbi:MAG: hypothetical protein ACOCUI_00995 [bacterium]